MYAVIATGGKQYRVAQGDSIRVEKLPAGEGESIDFDNVLMVHDGDNVSLGTPYVDGGKVTATVTAHGRGKKIRIIKFQRRKHHRKQMGHRQDYTEITITGISLNGVVSKAPAKPEKKEQPAAAPKPAAPVEAAPAASGAEPAFLDGPKGEPDDLKKISGVGPKLEEKLNGLGIYHFWQVAEFSKSDIDFVDDKLSFKGRIERDDWLGQAKKFAAGEE